MTSSTHLESDGQVYVTIQHCEVRKNNGETCDEYLGVNYPVTWCNNHDVVYGMFIQTRQNGLVADILSETVKPLIEELTNFVQGSEFKVATIREVTRRR